MRKEYFAGLMVAVLFLMSAIGAFLCFRLLESQAEITGTGWEAGGAVSGFIIIYQFLQYSYRNILRDLRPTLGGKQTLDLIYLFHESVKGRIIHQFIDWIDESESGIPIISIEERKKRLLALRDSSREYITEFCTPISDLTKHLELEWDSSFDDDFETAMLLLESDIPDNLKRKRLWEFADEIQHRLYKKCVEDLRRLKAI